MQFVIHRSVTEVPLSVASPGNPPGGNVQLSLGPLREVIDDDWGSIQRPSLAERTRQVQDRERRRGEKLWHQGRRTSAGMRANG